MEINADCLEFVRDHVNRIRLMGRSGNSYIDNYNLGRLRHYKMEIDRVKGNGDVRPMDDILEDIAELLYFTGNWGRIGWK